MTKDERTVYVIPFVVLGANDTPDKGMIAYRMPNSDMYNLTFVELANNGEYDFGDKIKTTDIKGAYQSIIFANVRSVDTVIRELQKIKALMEGEDENRGFTQVESSADRV